MQPRPHNSQLEMELQSVVRGYHIYKTIWGATIGEILQCTTEPGNSSDSHAVAVTKDHTVVGHIPRKFSAVCALFITNGGSITCIPTATRKFSDDLPQGGLEIPCKYIFEGDPKYINKVKMIFNILEVNLNMQFLSSDSANKPPHKRPRMTMNPKPDELEGGNWVTNAVNLTLRDKQFILNNENELNDKHIDHGLDLLHNQFPHISGLKSTLLQQSSRMLPLLAGKDALQIIHSRGNHWLVVSMIHSR